ncbi:hypothetical protein [Paludisphaera rhizosphaerae]|uniref:hypothetical protein n=1 Tax=Paludisphaera rhizosphaerae TaxID=2711216 RepID=UPI0013EE06C6|nr:hypothetical protein [Paludisphaera rhizosphaerae]
MKRLHRRWVEGYRFGVRQAELLGIGGAAYEAVLRFEKAMQEAEYVAAGLGPSPRRLSPEEVEAEKEAKREMSEARREALAEREAIQAVEREEDERIRREEEALKPKTFAPPPPDFERSIPEVVEASIEHQGLASPWPTMANLYRRDKQSQAYQREGKIGPGLAELRERSGPPEPPAVPTGWYQINGDSFCRVGSGPFPEYRPPGLVWRLYWTHPKPDDVPWEDEIIPSAPPVIPDRAEIIPPRVDAAEPTPPRPTGGKLKQGSLF